MEQNYEGEDANCQTLIWAFDLKFGREGNYFKQQNILKAQVKLFWIERKFKTKKIRVLLVWLIAQNAFSADNILILRMDSCWLLCPLQINVNPALRTITITSIHFLSPFRKFKLFYSFLMNFHFYIYSFGYHHDGETQFKNPSESFHIFSWMQTSRLKFYHLL